MLVNEVRECVETYLEHGKNKFLIFPFGEIGMEVKKILTEAYGISVEYIFDNYYSKYNTNIKPLSFLEEINCEQYVLILASKNSKIYAELKSSVLQYMKEENIAELSSMKSVTQNYTVTGKYSYGSLCNHRLVESVGAFCGFASGVDVVLNHATSYISVHPFISHDKNCNSIFHFYDEYKNEKWYFPGVIPKGEINKYKKTTIGNDVWLGKNVLVTNGADIGNGVIAAAGAVITKDIPDYAVVAGVPAKIIRYRYKPEEIEALNRIAWWKWSDDEIRARYDDFYLPIEEFIEKYDKNFEAEPNGVL